MFGALRALGVLLSLGARAVPCLAQRSTLDAALDRGLAGSGAAVIHQGGGPRTATYWIRCGSSATSRSACRTRADRLPADPAALLPG